MAQMLMTSAGIYSKDIDDTFLPPTGGGPIGAALVGLTQRGPAFLPQQVSSFGEWKERFGGVSPDLPCAYAAKSYLKSSNNLNQVRVLGRSTAAIGAAVVLAFPGNGISASGCLSQAAVTSLTGVAVLRFRSTVEEVNISGNARNFAIAIPGKAVTATNLSLDRTSGNYLGKVVGTDPINVKGGDSLTALYLEAIFDYDISNFSTGCISGNAAMAQFATATSDFSNVTGGFSQAQTPIFVSQNYNGSVYPLFALHTLSHGDSTNDLYKVSITQIDLSVSAYPSFTVVVRDFNDTDNNLVALEQFTNVNLNPASKQYIGRVIGDRSVAYDLTQTPPEILFNGDFPNNSKIVRVQVYDGFPVDSHPSGFQGVAKILPFASSASGVLSSLPLVTNQVSSKTSQVDDSVFLGVDFSTFGVKDRLKRGITSASGTTMNDRGVLFFATGSDNFASASSNTTLGASYIMVPTSISAVATSSNFSSTNFLRFTAPMFGGFDGYDPRVDKRVAINDGTLSADFNVALRTLANPDEIDFNLIAVPGVHSSSVGNVPDLVISMIEARNDAFYILDIANGTTTAAPLAMTIAQAQVEADKYDTNSAATYYPWIKIYDADNDKLVWVPPSVEMMGVYAFNDRVAQQWWAPAGFSRGSLDSVLEVRRRLTQGQRDDLQARRINPIATFSGQGIVVWGQSTLQQKESLLSRINVKRMLITVRKSIASFAKRFIFEPNTSSTRSGLLSEINRYLSSVQSAYGLTEFRAILDETTTTPEMIDRNTLKGVILLRPTTAVEVILLDFTLSKSGSFFSA